MILTKGEVNSISVFDKKYEIITNARYWINKTIELENSRDEKEQLSIMFDCIIDRPYFLQSDKLYKKRLLRKIIQFYYCDYESPNDYKENKKQMNKLYNFCIDGGRIFSAFYKTYHIDIESMLDTLHWWKFMAMFNDLSESSIFKSVYMYYRSYDKANAEYQKMSSEQKSKIDRQIKRVLLTEHNSISNFYADANKKSKLDIKRESAFIDK